MNKKFYTMIMTCLFSGAAFTATGETVNLGYCSGEVASSGAFTVDGKRWVSGAVYLPPSMLAPYQGNEISAVRAGLAGKTNVDSVRVWVRSELEGDNLSENVITLKGDDKIKRGWNDVALTQPVMIDGSGLYVGYSYHQKAEAGAFSAVGAGIENSFYGQLSPSEGWQDLSSYGVLSVEAVVEGASRPDYDLGIVDAMASMTVDGSGYGVDVSLVNNGERAVTGFTLEAAYAEGMAYEFCMEDILAPGEKRIVDIKVPVPDDASVMSPEMVVTLKSIADGDDAVAENNRLKVRFKFKKRVLVEEYTTEQCGNCPRVAGYLHEVLEMERYKDKVFAVCHHAGFYDDWLTQDCDREMAHFFSVGYAPAMSFDRFPMFGNANGMITHCCPDKAAIMTSIDSRLDEDAHTNIVIDTRVDQDPDIVDVTVGVERDGAFTSKDIYLTLYLVENNVKARRQSGADGDSFHQHVIRLCNSTWGDMVKWDFNSFTADYQFSLNPEWDREQMEIVAVVGQYDPSDSNESWVDNCASVRLPGNASVETVSDCERVAEEYYTLTGMRIPSPEGYPGVIVRRSVCSDCSVKVSKILNTQK